MNTEIDTSGKTVAPDNGRVVKRTGSVGPAARTRPWNSRRSFIKEFEGLPMDDLAGISEYAGPDDVERALAVERASLEDIAALISPAAQSYLTRAAERAQTATLKRFGRTVQMFAPLYLSNDCVNTCLYCGFSMKNKIERKTLTIEEVSTEADLLVERGFRHLLLVSAEHPKHVSPDYISECIARVGGVAHAVQIEVQAFDRTAYGHFKDSGCDGVVLYQETYDRDMYEQLHVHGMKKDFENRLDAADRIGLSGMRHVGLGVLLGLNKNWRKDVLAVAAHAMYMQRNYWRTAVTVSLPRMRPAAGGFRGAAEVADREFLLAVCALRLALPEAGIVLSTRERPEMRDALIGVGVTNMSAGSSTQPGGYGDEGCAEEQFSISDTRSASQMASAISALGYEPVWKDWEYEL